MPKKRKDPNIPLAKPPQEEVPVDEQWRLINESGLLAQKIPRRPTETPTTGPQGQDFADEIFFAMILIIPFTFLFLIMDIMIHQQYAQHPTFLEEATTVAKAFPFITVSIFYSNRYKSSRTVQTILFILSIVCGTQMIYHINNASWTVVMQQCPPLATIWVYSIVQLDLLPAVASLIGVYGAVWYLNLKILFH